MPVWCSPPSVTWRLSGPWPTASAGTRDRRTPTSAPVLDALLAFVEARYADCAAVLGALPPSELTRLGGNAPRTAAQSAYRASTKASSASSTGADVGVRRSRVPADAVGHGPDSRHVTDGGEHQTGMHGGEREWRLSCDRRGQRQQCVVRRYDLTAQRQPPLQRPGVDDAAP